ISVNIGGTTYKLFTVDDHAWAATAQEDKQLVEAMKKGSTMVIKGASSRGTETTDTYSLSGFTKAYEEIGKACKVSG
ncbi:invasion associated locus B family protein, partial [Oceanibaculum nanhaiense]